MKRVFLSLAILSLSLPAFADGILCFRDARPVDGNYLEVKLAATGNGYDLTSKVISSGFGGRVQGKETTLATDLRCNIDGLIAYCFKSSVESGDSSNSSVKFQLVEKTQLNSLSQQEAVMAPAQIDIEVGSPLVSELRKRYSFRVSQIFGGCREL